MIKTKQERLFQPLELPCGTVLKNRIVKSAMSDSLGDGRGNPTEAQMRLYQRWAEGGLAASIIGEVQGNPKFVERPGNVVLGPRSDLDRFQILAERGSVNGTQLWLQLGHAGALAYSPISDPKGPSALNFPHLKCAEMTKEEVSALPSAFAQTAALAKSLGFGGVQIHAAHGFLLSQFLSPLFNRRKDKYGGTITNRMRLVLEVLEEVRCAVGARFPIAIKLNATDQLEGGFDEVDALKVIRALDGSEIDLIDISGGTYFPGAKSTSESPGGKPYFLDFAENARVLTRKPLMVTGGFKTHRQAIDAMAKGVDLIGLARALVLDPSLPNAWRAGMRGDPVFPKFEDHIAGGITAWYTMRMTDIGEGRKVSQVWDLHSALRTYEERDLARVEVWKAHWH